MIESYEPQDRNYHYIKVTFAHANYFGHIVIKVGGNCKGASILSEGLDFWENCDTEDIGNLVHNDCQLSIYDDGCGDYEFKITLSKPSTDDTVCFEELDYQELTDMIIAVEFIKVEPQEYSELIYQEGVD